MQLDGVQHIVAKQPAQERQRAVLVHVVHALQRGRGAQVVQQMSQVVQQRGGHQRVAGAFVFGQHGALQRVLQLRHRLARVLLAALVSKQLFDVAQAQTHGRE
jgi:hypothetical protein